MVGDDAHIRQPVEQPREHDARHRHARFVRPSQHLPDLELGLLLVDVVGARRRPRGMHPDRKMVLARHALEHREEFRLVERAAVDAGENLHAARAELADCAIHLLQRRRHVVHGQGCDKRRELPRPARAHRRHVVVGDAGELGRKLRPADQLGPRQRERQHLLHLRPLLEHGDARLDVPQHAQAPHALDDARVLEVGLHHVEVARGHDVVEDIDFHGPPRTRSMTARQSRGNSLARQATC